MRYPFDIYLAQPYSACDPYVEATRFSHGARAAAWLMDRGLVVYAPIVHSHPIVDYLTTRSTTWTWWEKIDSRIIGACQAVIVLEIPGWEQSVGVKAELAIAERRQKTVGRMIPVDDTYRVVGLEHLFGGLG